MYIEHPEIVRDNKYLTREEDIVDYFTDECMTYLEADSEGYTSEVTIFAAIGEIYYEVIIKASFSLDETEWNNTEIYTLDKVDSVEYKQIDLQYIITTINNKILKEIDFHNNKIKTLKSIIIKL